MQYNPPLIQWNPRKKANKKKPTPFQNHCHFDYVQPVVQLFFFGKYSLATLEYTRPCRSKRKEKKRQKKRQKRPWPVSDAGRPGRGCAWCCGSSRRWLRGSGRPASAAGRAPPLRPGTPRGSESPPTPRPPPSRPRPPDPDDNDNNNNNKENDAVNILARLDAVTLTGLKTGYNGLYWVRMSFHGFYWVPMGSTGLYWVMMGFTGLYWVMMDFTGFYWVILGYDGLYWVMMNFNGFYWVLLGYTGLKWVILGYDEF